MALPAPSGSTTQLDSFFETLYQELMRIAHGRFSQATPTLDTVAVVSKAYEKLRRSRGTMWCEAEHVKAAACVAMRQILLNYLRDRQAAKRGGAERPVTFEDDLMGDFSEDQLIDHLAGMEALAKLETRTCSVVEMRYFGYQIQEIAETLGISGSTVKRELEKGRKVLCAFTAS